MELRVIDLIVTHRLFRREEGGGRRKEQVARYAKMTRMLAIQSFQRPASDLVSCLELKSIQRLKTHQNEH